MNNKKEKKEKIDIIFRIIEIKKISHSEHDYNEYGLTEGDLKKAQLKVGVKFEIHIDEGCLSFTIISRLECEKEKESYELFNMEVLYKFEIKDFNNVFKVSGPKKVIIPDQFIQTLIGIAISGARGIQAVIITNQAYKNKLIPLINTKEILNLLKLKGIKKIKVDI